MLYLRKQVCLRDFGCALVHQGALLRCAAPESTKLVIEYFLEKMVSSVNQKFGMNVILGLTHQFIQMGQSWFNAEQNQNNESLGESHLF